MNLFRNIIGSSRGGSTQPSSAQEPSLQSAADRNVDPGGNRSRNELDLAVGHFRREFSEFQRNESRRADQSDQDIRLYRMCPVFIQIFGKVSLNYFPEVLPDYIKFACACSRLFVREIRRRATGKVPDDAAQSLADFLMIRDQLDEEFVRVMTPNNPDLAADAPPQSTDPTRSTQRADAKRKSDLVETMENENGWALLNTLSMLSQSSADVLSCIVQYAVPSTLVRCVYLFCDLPQLLDAPTDEEKSIADSAVLTTSTETEATSSYYYSAGEKRALLEKVMLPFLVRLVAVQSAVHEIAKSNGVSLLLLSVTQPCATRNTAWKRGAADVLIAACTHRTIGERECLASLQRANALQSVVRNLERFVLGGDGEASGGNETSKQKTTRSGADWFDLVRSLETVLAVLRASAEFTQTLLDEFRNANGYALLTNILTALDSVVYELESGSAALSTEGEAEWVRDAVRNVVVQVGSFVTVGTTELRPVLPGGAAHFSPVASAFRLPQPDPQRAMSIRNVAAFRVLQNAFVYARSTYVASTILDIVCGIYQQDAANYFIVADQNTLCAFAERIAAHATSVQRKFFSILEYVVQLDYVPYRELVVLSTLIRNVPTALRAASIATSNTTSPAPAAPAPTAPTSASASQPQQLTGSNLRSSLRCATLCMRTLIKMLYYDARHKDAFEQLGLLDSFIIAAQRFADELNQRGAAQNSRLSASVSSYPSVSDAAFAADATATVSGSTEDYSAAWCAFELLILRALGLLVEGNGPCATVFVDRGGIALLISHIGGHETSRAALEVYAKLLLTMSAVEEHLTSLLSVLRNTNITYFCAAPRAAAVARERTLDDSDAQPTFTSGQRDNDTGITDVPGSPGVAGLGEPICYTVTRSTLETDKLRLKVDVLRALCTVFNSERRVRVAFRKREGFLTLLTLLVSLEDSLRRAEPFIEPPPASHGHAEFDLENVTDTSSNVFALTSPMPTKKRRAAWRSVVFSLIRAVFVALVTAMRGEPASARYFANEIRFSQLARALVLLGCFRKEDDSESDRDAESHDSRVKSWLSTPTQPGRFAAWFNSVLALTDGDCVLEECTNLDASFVNRVDFHLQSALFVMRCLFDFAVGEVDGDPFLRTAPFGAPTSPLGPSASMPSFEKTSQTDSASSSCWHWTYSESDALQRVFSTGSTTTTATTTTATTAAARSSRVPQLVHPGAIVTLLQLVRHLRRCGTPNESLYTKGEPHANSLVDLTAFAFELLRFLMQLERNEQMLCDARVAHELLVHFGGELFDESHPLHASVRFVFERLSVLHCAPNDLRKFVRACVALNEADELVRNSAANCSRIRRRHDSANSRASSRSRSRSRSPKRYRSRFDSNCEQLGTQRAVLACLERLNRLVTSRTCWIELPATVTDDELRVAHYVNYVTSDRAARLSALASTDIDGSDGVASVVQRDDAMKMQVELGRLRSLVSMSTPRDGRLPQGTPLSNAFVELDMSAPDGFACLYVPSVAPQLPTASVSTVGSSVHFSSAVSGGFGPAERAFPPATGFAFLAWFCVDRFTTEPANLTHPVRLLTLTRHVSGRDDQLVCLSITLNSSDRSLIVSTAEKLLPNASQQQQPPPQQQVDPIVEYDRHAAGDNTVRFPAQDLGVEGVWQHVAIVFQRAGMLKNSSVTAYLNGVSLGTQKCTYILPNFALSSSSAQVSFVSAYVGTPPQLRRACNLRWRITSVHLLEDALTPAAVANICTAGVNHVGSFQSVPNGVAIGAAEYPAASAGQPLATASGYQLVAVTSGYHVTVSDERVVFSLFAHAVSTMTVTRIRRVFNAADARLIARQLTLSTHDNSTPIRLIHNAALGLPGDASRPLGAALLGQLGSRCFTPRPVGVTLAQCGGAAALLGLVALAHDRETLHAATKCLACATKHDRALARDLERVRGYRVLSALLRAKRVLLNANVLHLVLSLVCDFVSPVSAPEASAAGIAAVPARRSRRSLIVRGSRVFTDATAIPTATQHPNGLNSAAFEDLLCDLETWSVVAPDLQKMVFEFLVELAVDSATRRLLKDLGMVVRLLHFVRDARLSPDVLSAIFAVLHVLFESALDDRDLLTLGQFVVSTLPAGYSEKTLQLHSQPQPQPVATDDSMDSLTLPAPAHAQSSAQYKIRARNMCLQLLLNMLNAPTAAAAGASQNASQNSGGNTTQSALVERVLRSLGFDWIFQLLQPGVHGSSVVIAMHLLVCLLSSPAQIQKFREALMLNWYGGWLEGADQVIAATGISEDSVDSASSNEMRVSREVCRVPGFQALSSYLLAHCDIAEVYFLLFALQLGQQVREIPPNLKFDLDSMLKYMFDLPNSTASAAAAGTANAPNSSSFAGRKPTSSGELCADAAHVMLCMLRQMMNATEFSQPQAANRTMSQSMTLTQSIGSAGNDESDTMSWLRDYPRTLVQSFMSLYHNYPNFSTICISPDFLTALVATLFPHLHPSVAHTPEDTKSQFGWSDEHARSPGPTATSSSCLTQHPARKYVFDLLRVIAFDSLTATNASKTQCVFDIIIEAVPEYASKQQVKEYHTELLYALMEHLTAAEAFLDESAAAAPLPFGNLPFGGAGSLQAIGSNTIYVAGRIVDQLWSGTYTRDARDVLQFAWRLVTQMKKRRSTTLQQLELVYRCLNRTSLFLLSRPHTQTQKYGVAVEVLRWLVAQRNIMFAPANADREFFGCLCFLLIQMLTELSQPDTVAEDQRNEVEQAVKQTWEEMYLSKKELLEDVLRFNLNPVNVNIAQIQHPDLWEIRNLLAEKARPVWVTYLNDQEGVADPVNLTSSIDNVGYSPSAITSASSQPSEKQAAGRTSSITQRLSRMGSEVFRIAMRKPKSAQHVRAAHFNVTEAARWAQIHQRTVQRLVDLHVEQLCETRSYVRRCVQAEWTSLCFDLVRECGLFGPRHASALDKWQLDVLEGPCRMRKRVWRNDAFYQLFPFRPGPDYEKSGKHKPPTSKDSKLYYLLYHAPRAEAEQLASASSEKIHAGDQPDLVQTDAAHGNEGEAEASTELGVGEEINMAELQERSMQLQETVHLLGKKMSRAGASDAPLALEEDFLDSDANANAVSGSATSGALSPASTSNDSKSEQDEATRLQRPTLRQDTRKAFTPPPTSPQSASASTPTGGLPPRSNTLSVTNPASSSSSTVDRTDGAAPVESATWKSRLASHTVLRLIEDGDRIVCVFRCVRVQGLDSLEGLLLFCREHVFVIDGFTVLRNGQIVDTDRLAASSRNELYEPIVPRPSHSTSSSSSSNDQAQQARTIVKLRYDELSAVKRRRYLLQPIALELFGLDGRTVLLAFTARTRASVLETFSQLLPRSVTAANRDDADTLLTGGGTGIADRERDRAEIGGGATGGGGWLPGGAAAGGWFAQLMGNEKSLSQRWANGELSNFEYLMQLNTLAGRSYNDLMQYPVFPWILADYDSDELDLSNPATFRDLGRPMGAQSNERLEQFRKRYAEWDDPTGETPPYHYGTHYSSAMIVVSYLVRLEPFTSAFLRLQGGHFDLADRMFHSIKEAWLSASRHNMADVRELIPEFFYLPDFLANKNRFELGTKQNGVELNDVLLPKWAKNDPREFIRAHREALESDYVSAHLHEWIDLIFGCAQRDERAEASVNVFHPLFYEGNVDVFAIEDPLKQSAVIGFINNFGQIPKQLFKKPHIAKKLGVPRQLFFHQLDTLRPPSRPIRELRQRETVGQIMQVGEKLSLSNPATLHMVEANKCLIPPTYSRYVSWGYPDRCLRLCAYDSDRPIATFDLAELCGDIMCATCPNARIIVVGGTTTLVHIFELTAFAEQSSTSLASLGAPPSAMGAMSGAAWVGGTGAPVSVSSLASAVSSAAGMVSAGSGSSPAAPKRLLLRAALSGHREPITCLASSAAWNVCVSGSQDCCAIVWDLVRLRFAHHLANHGSPIACVAINEANGDIVTCAGTLLSVFTINGEPIASISTASGIRAGQQLLCVAFSTLCDWDSASVIVTGANDGVVRMWSVQYVQVAAAATNTANATEGRQDRPAHSEFDNEPPATAARRPPRIRRSSNEDSELVGSDVVSSNGKKKREDDEEGEEDDDDAQFGDATRSSETSSVSSAQRPTPTSAQAPSQLAELELAREVLAAAADATSLPQLPLQRTFIDSGEQAKAAVTESPIGGQASAMLRVDEKELYGSYARLRAGFKWQRSVLYRSKLTMHTAFERSDNREPSAVTCVAISRDHRVLLVGDANGRVWAWTVADQPGRADNWKDDETVEVCPGCDVRFSPFERKHHCRNCGGVFCSRCSRYEIEIARIVPLKPVRVCVTCYFALKQVQAGANTNPGPASTPGAGGGTGTGTGTGTGAGAPQRLASP